MVPHCLDQKLQAPQAGIQKACDLAPKALWGIVSPLSPYHPLTLLISIALIDMSLIPALPVTTVSKVRAKRFPCMNSEVIHPQGCPAGTYPTLSHFRSSWAHGLCPSELLKDTALL